MPKVKKEKQPSAPWTAEHDTTLAHAITAHVLRARRALYATPGLSDVTDHGGERINKKIQAILRASFGPEVVAAEIAALKVKPNDDGSADGDVKPAKRVKADPARGKKTSKKHKAPSDDDELEEEQ